MNNSQTALVAFAFLLIRVYSAPSTDCQYVDCPPGFGCDQGICLKQTHEPRKTICSLFNNLTPIKCTDRDYECVGVPSLPSCGFTAGKAKFDFQNDCLPCLSKNIAFFYRAPCSEAPAICQPSQECVNGKCMNFKGMKTDQNQVSCTSRADCKPILETCFAGKCVSIMEAANLLKRAGVSSPI